ncbi:DNA double-strand break repair nuclease NurA [Candidatus Micrarchaeota archaeon]|jgi:hypothetical protein|nr:DNA double-strand break repair nuclease NurA [Candidatus Micrarchaeota archaeon]
MTNALEHIKTIKSKCRDICSSLTFYDIKHDPINFSVGAVDSGFVVKKQMGFDVVICRASGAIYNYQNNELIKTTYLNNSFKPEQTIIFSDEEIYTGAPHSIYRLKKEIENAIKLTDHSPNLLLLDGSIVPLPINKPQKSSEFYQQYLELIKLYEKLYSLCKTNKIHLAGVIKDTYGKILIQSLKENKTLSVTDSFLLNTCMKPQTRTEFLNYGAGLHPTIEDIKFPAKIVVSYLRPSDLDSVLRVEVVDLFENYQETYEMVNSLCSLNRHYAYPPPLVDIDLKVKLKPHEIENISREFNMFNQIQRRDNRPF